uniref:Reverse transcriptase Ty1/copia-type domain-containing protein n=1 Tax=Mycena chlorophos TaxID=658473 RepID=A0ABQ0L2Z3_MYCCL|nr:predicted protein [Mycena chlorophos]
MIIAHNLPKFLWPQAVIHSAYIINRSPTASLKVDKTPYEGFWKRKPDVSNLQEFGASCWVLIQGEKPPKIGARSEAYQFVGLSEDAAAWHYYVPKTCKILRSRNVVFEEIPDTPAEIEDPIRLEGESGKVSDPTSAQAPEAAQKPGNTEVAQQPLPQTPITAPTAPKRNVLQVPPRDPVPRRAAAEKHFLESDMWRAIRNPSNLSPAKPDAWRHRVADDSHMAAMAVEPDPTSYRQALEHTRAVGWKDAMVTEIQQLVDLGTFSFTTLPPGRKALGNKWVYTTKENHLGDLDWLKARLVVLGNTAIPGTDYNPDQISSPVARAETNRLLIALAAYFDLEMRTVDVKGAYLNGTLKEEIYMRQPEGFRDGSDRVLQLHKTLYGLPQSGREWNEMLDEQFKTIGFSRLVSDRCVYIRWENSGFAIVAVHVDDMAMYATSGDLITRTEDQLASAFTITRLGDAKQLLGMEIHRDRGRKTITITQTNYIRKILAQHGYDIANSAATPMDPNVILEKLPDGKSYPDIKQTYQSMVGALMYAAITTRPDIAYAVQTLSQYSINPGPVHLTAVKHVYRYLRGTINLGITYSADGNPHLTMHADHTDVRPPEIAGAEPVVFTDADWANNRDDRKSISGFVSTLAGGAISWSSKKQPSVALSTMEAEYIALSHAARENLWLRALFAELGKPPSAPTPIYCDNRGAIDFTFNQRFHGRSKHIDMRHHFIRDHVALGDVSVHHCASADNLADIFTKPLARDAHELQVRKLGMTRV